MSTTHSSFDQNCISHKTISHRAAAAPGPEVRRKCTRGIIPSLPLLATNPGDATVTRRLIWLPIWSDNHLFLQPIDCAYYNAIGKLMWLSYARQNPSQCVYAQVLTSS